MQIYFLALCIFTGKSLKNGESIIECCSVLIYTAVVCQKSNNSISGLSCMAIIFNLTEFSMKPM